MVRQFLMYDLVLHGPVHKCHRRFKVHSLGKIILSYLYNYYSAPILILLIAVPDREERTLGYYCGRKLVYVIAWVAV